MATIGNVQLTIGENQGFAAASVNYTLKGDVQDVQLHRVYREVVELIGVDTLPGEDGRDEPLPVDRFEGGLIFFNTADVPRTRVFAMPATALDEDPSQLLLVRDEIKARVTLTPVPPSTRRDSNIVTRGEVLPPIAVPA